MDTWGKETGVKLSAYRALLPIAGRFLWLRGNAEMRMSLEETESMKKSLVLLAGASLAFLGLPAVSHAQAASGPFADVPTDHWAYQSVDTLQKAGIVIGYPDGTYGGRRPMTRYEFAVAIARLLAQMHPGVSAADLAALRTDLENRIAGNTAAIDALRTLVNGFQPELTRLGQDVAAADARLDSLEARVNTLTTRVDDLSGAVGAIADEQRRVKITGEANVIFRGDSSKRSLGAGQLPFMDQNGVYQGAGLTAYGTPITRNSLLSSSDVYEDVLLHIRGRVADTAIANVDLDFGNYMDQVHNTAAFGSQTPFANSGGFLPFGGLVPGNSTSAQNNAQNLNVYKAYLDAAVKLGPLGGAELLVGRFGNQFTKYTLKQADADLYTNLTQTDSGDLLGDGIGLNLKVGPAKLNMFASKFKGIEFSQPYAGSAAFGPAPAGQAAPVGSIGNLVERGQTRPGGLIPENHAMPIDDGIGVHATFGTPETFNLGVTAEQFGLDNNLGGTTFNGTPLTLFDGTNDPNRPFTSKNAQFNRLSVYGVDFNGGLPFGLPGVKKGGVLVDAAYTVSAQGINSGFNNVGKDFRYQSYDANLGFSIGGLHLKGGYQYVGPEFSAPGYWGKLGAWTNPTNVRGEVVSAKYAITPKLSFNADGNFYTGAYATNATGTRINSPISGKVNYFDAGKGKFVQGGADHISRYQVGLAYGLTSNYGVDLGYEDVQYDLRNQAGTAVTGLAHGGRPEENYVNIGLGHTISNNASIKLLYQIVHYDDKGTGFDTVASPTGGKSDGSVASAQFQIKF